jgi:hypothetical protein
VVTQGPGNSLDFYWALNGTSKWHQETVAGPGTTYSAPAVIGIDDDANVVALGPRNVLDFYWQTNGTSQWHPEEVKGSAVYGPPAITTDYAGGVDGVDVVAQGQSTALTTYTDNNGPWQANAVHGSGTSSAQGVAGSAATVTENNGSENIAVFAPNGDLDFYWRDSNGTFQKELVSPASIN